MKLHLVGGFLGSGKTTAITNASKLLRKRDILAGVITNDQGNYLIDSSFATSFDIPTGEVKGGCFCCNYNDLDAQINKLLENNQPKEIFAESVGSCTDLVATVLKPLIKHGARDISEISFSVFVDSMLLLSHLQNLPIGFTEDVKYIFLKQIEEASVLVVNKVDLLSDEQLAKLKTLIEAGYSDKKVIYQNSLDEEGISNWLKTIDKTQVNADDKSLDIDYQVYGKGEMDLAWLDEEIEIIGNNAYNSSIELIDKIYNKLNDENIRIGHLKFLLSDKKQFEKISFTATPILNWQEQVKKIDSNKITLILNARAQTTPENLRQIVVDIIEEMRKNRDIEINEFCVSAFKPGFPNPTYRYAS